MLHMPFQGSRSHLNEPIWVEWTPSVYKPLLCPAGHLICEEVEHEAISTDQHQLSVRKLLHHVSQCHLYQGTQRV